MWNIRHSLVLPARLRVLAGLNYQHDGAQVELGVELGDEDMCGHEVARVAVLHVSDNVHHPLKVLLRAGHPQEVHLRQSTGPSASEAAVEDQHWQYLTERFILRRTM